MFTNTKWHSKWRERTSPRVLIAIYPNEQWFYIFFLINSDFLINNELFSKCCAYNHIYIIKLVVNF